MISRLVAALRHIDPEITDKDIAEVLWLALQIRKAVGAPQLDSNATHSEAPSKPLSMDKTNLPPKLSTSKPPQPTKSGLYPSSSQNGSGGQALSVLPFPSPAATALPGSLDIARVLRPFGRRVRQPSTFVLNEEDTAKRIAEEDIWVPILDHALTRWLEIALVIDIGRSMSIWRQTITELHRLLARHGAFRDVRLWELSTNDVGVARLYAGTGKGIQDRQPRSELELIDISSRRLILVVTDCISAAWHSGSVTNMMAKWGHYNPVTLLQVLPRRLWSRTALGMANSVRLHAASPGTVNRQLHVQSTKYWDDEDSLPTLPIPIVTLEPRSLTSWAQAIARAEDVWIPGFELVIRSQTVEKQEQNDYTLYEEALTVELFATQRVQRFRANASTSACRLAGLLATLPITLPIVRLVQQAMFLAPLQVHVAEVFLSGLLEIVSANSDALDPDEVQYDFVNGVREILLNSVPLNDSSRVLTEISALITSKFAHPLDFGALLANPLGKEGIVIDKENRPFALMGAKALRRFGGKYVALAAWLEEESSKGEEQDDIRGMYVDVYELEGVDAREQVQGEGTVSSEQVVLGDKVADDSAKMMAQKAVDSGGILEDATEIAESSGAEELVEDNPIVGHIREAEIGEKREEKNLAEEDESVENTQQRWGAVVSNDRPPQSKEVIQGILWGHKTKLEEIRKIFFFGENRQDIYKPVIELFEKDLRKMIEELEGLRAEKYVSLFINSVYAIQENVSDIVDMLTLASSTFGSKETDTALKKRLEYFKACRPLLNEALEQFKPALKPNKTKEDAQSA